MLLLAGLNLFLSFDFGLLTPKETNALAFGWWLLIILPKYIVLWNSRKHAVSIDSTTLC